MSTEQESVPASPMVEVPPEASPRRGWWRYWLAAGLVVALVGGVLASFRIQVPYFEFRPGSATPVAPLVVVEDVERYDPTGGVAFTTVTLRRTTVASYVLAWFDDDVEVIEERRILGDRTPSENRQFNLQLMNTSKQDAIRVALLELGYEVPVSVDGFVVTQVLDGSAAAGVFERGDTILRIADQPVDGIDSISTIMAGRPPGETVVVEYEPPTRDGTETVEVTLGENPENPDQGLIGITLEPRNPQYDFPFPIDIESGSVGGDSAGLAFTLAVLDVLTPGELTGGLLVATTGTIDPAGNVGPVGGVAQKTAAVIDAGYDVFLVPPLEFEEATARAGDALRVISVSTLGEALAALESLGGSGLGTPIAN